MEDLNDKPKKKKVDDEPVLPFPYDTPLEPLKEDAAPPTNKVPVTGILTSEERERLYEKDDDEPYWNR